MANSKKKCVICKRKHIISTNKSGIFCHYCKINRKEQIRLYQAKKTPLVWANKFKQLVDSNMKPDTIILKFLQYADEQERAVYRRLRK